MVRLLNFYSSLLFLLLSINTTSATAICDQVLKTKVVKGDCEALVDLYNSTNGKDWSFKTNWLSNKPVAEWLWVGVSGSRVVTLKLNSNNLKGSIPSSIGNLTQLKELELYGNKLGGQIPSTIGNLSQLERLHLFNNQLSGYIPNSIGNLKQLNELELYKNKLTGPIPASIGNLSQLEILYLTDNQLTGAIPSSIGKLSQLSWLMLNYNQLSGIIPITIGNLTNLNYLNLERNMFSGSLSPNHFSSSLGQEVTLDTNCLKDLDGPTLQRLIDLQIQYFTFYPQRSKKECGVTKSSDGLQYDKSGNRVITRDFISGEIMGNSAAAKKPQEAMKKQMEQ